VPMGHDQRDRLKDYWFTLEQFLWLFMETQWNKTDSSIYWDFFILVTIKMTRT
jgi:hypothetical protein